MKKYALFCLEVESTVRNHYLFIISLKVVKTLQMYNIVLNCEYQSYDDLDTYTFRDISLNPIG